MTADKVWVVMTHEYEGDTVWGIYRNFDSAVDDTKARYVHPYIVRWELIEGDGDNVLIGYFESVPHYSIQHKSRFYIEEMVIK
ncbi:hypothetical protein LCGC14_2940300 [marine sediment metagenome]|uniref:Uncharacterized protein n=1 Tax=marine sediment metagenome TaxID=412755 RepID=A0A0F9A9B2_9ZZZZ